MSGEKTMISRASAVVLAALWTLYGSAALGSIAQGYAYKEGEIYHSGIRVEVPTCVSCLDKYTNSAGHYGPWVAIGGGKTHTFRYSCAGYKPAEQRYYIPPLGSVTLPPITLLRDIDCEDIPWTDFPYEPEGSDISFCADEGQHKPYFPNFPMEWWSAHFHLAEVGDSSREYGVFVAFVKEPRMRLFAVSDIKLGEMFADRTRLCPVSSIGEHWLDLAYCHLGFSDAASDEAFIPVDYTEVGTLPVDPGPMGGRTMLRRTFGAEGAPAESPGAAGSVSIPDDLVSIPDDLVLVSGVSVSDSDIADASLACSGCDRWYNVRSGGDPQPYIYRLEVQGEDSGRMALSVDMASRKVPLMVGGQGLVDIGDGQSHYYSHSRIDVSGTLRVHGRTAKVVGEAWMDHQWGNFRPQDISWERFSIQLDDSREILVGTQWSLEAEPIVRDGYLGGLNLLDEYCQLEVLSDYSIEALETVEIDDTIYGTRWSIQADGIDLIVEADMDDQVFHLTEQYVLTPGFWEGSCTVSGTIDGQAVSGKAYVESIHGTGGGGSGGSVVEPTQGLISGNAANR